MELNKAWDGKGLPPVGTVCETEAGGKVRRILVLGVGLQRLLGRDLDSNEEYGFLTAARVYRAIKTPEQMVAEARAARVSELMHDAGITGSAFADDPEALAWAEALLDSGWAKPCEP